MARWLAPLVCMLGCPLLMGALMWGRPGARKATQPAGAAPPPGPSMATRSTTDPDRTTEAAPGATARPSWIRTLWCAACVNWKVIAGLAAAAGAIALVRPGALVVAGPVLLVLVCPLSMLVAMVAMSRRRSGSAPGCHTPPPGATVGQTEPVSSSGLTPAEATGRPGKG